MPVPKHRPVVTTSGSMPSALIASYMAMQLWTVMIEMNTSAVPAPAAGHRRLRPRRRSPRVGARHRRDRDAGRVEHRLQQRAVAPAWPAAGCWRSMTAAFFGFGSSRLMANFAMPGITPTEPVGYADAGGGQEVGGGHGVADDHRLLAAEHVVQLLVAVEQGAGQHERDVGVVEHLARRTWRRPRRSSTSHVDEFARPAAEAAEFGVDVFDRRVDADRVLREHRFLVDVADLERLAARLAGCRSGVVDAPLVDLLLREVALRRLRRRSQRSCPTWPPCRTVRRCRRVRCCRRAPPYRRARPFLRARAVSAPESPPLESSFRAQRRTRVRQRLPPPSA